MKRKITLFAIIAALTISIFCGCSLIPSKEVSSAPGTAAGILTEAVTSLQENTLSSEQAAELFTDLVDQSLRYVKSGDKDGFATLFVNTDDETIANKFSVYQDRLDNVERLPDQQYYVPLVNKNSFVGCAVWSLTTGTYPNTKFSSNYFWETCSIINGECKYDCSEATAEAIDEILLPLYPAEAMEANSQGRNVASFCGSDFSWLDSSIVIPGCLKADVMFAWQNADGSVGLFVNVKNGTDEIINLNKISVKLSNHSAQDDDLGTICDKTFEIGEYIYPQCNTTYTFTVNASEVYTGMSEWEYVNCSCDCDFN